MSVIVRSCISLVLVFSLILPAPVFAQAFGTRDGEITSSGTVDSGTGGGNNDTGTMIGLSVFGAVVLYATGVYLWNRHKRKKRRKKSPEEPPSTVYIQDEEVSPCRRNPCVIENYSTLDASHRRIVRITMQPHEQRTLDENDNNFPEDTNDWGVDETTGNTWARTPVGPKMSMTPESIVSGDSNNVFFDPQPIYDDVRNDDDHYVRTLSTQTCPRIPGHQCICSHAIPEPGRPDPPPEDVRGTHRFDVIRWHEMPNGTWIKVIITIEYDGMKTVRRGHCYKLSRPM